MMPLIKGFGVSLWALMRWMSSKATSIFSMRCCCKYSRLRKLEACRMLITDAMTREMMVLVSMAIRFKCSVQAHNQRHLTTH